jgi:hypothetical protein
VNPHQHRVSRSLAAGVLGAARWLAVFGVVLVIGLVITQSLLLWRETGVFELLPGQASGPNRPDDVVALAATDRQADAIRAEVSGLAYQLPPGALTFGVTPEPCPTCGGEYIAGLGLIRLQQDLVNQNGPILQHAIAHEVGHYVDDTYLNDDLRARFRQLRGIPSGLSWLSPNKPWADRPAEDFGEVFAMLNMTTADGPIQTSYGPIRNRAALVGVLDSAGVSLERPPSPPRWELVIAREVSFARYMTSDWRMRLALLGLAVFYAAYGGIPAARRAWEGT